MRSPLRALTLTALLLALSAAALAAPIFPPGDDPALDALYLRHGRQFYAFNAYPFGLSLDVHVKDQAARALIDQFLSQTASDDVQAVTGKHPYELVASFGEHGDLGFFGGCALLGTVFEYQTLKRDGAPIEQVARARERLVRAARSWHVFKVVPGGVVARGIRRLVPENPADPPVPGEPTATLALFDGEGKPLPYKKDNGSERADNSRGALPEGVWSWIDSASKDQLVGQVFAMTALYDALKDDPAIDQSLVDDLVHDARLIADMLMEKRDISKLEGPVGKGLYDLIIMDADGRPTKFHDLNPFSLEKLYMNPAKGVFNKFNLVMALGIVKGLHHITGAADIEEYLYGELMSRRQYLDMVNRGKEQGSTDYIYMGINTNTDDPDMTAVALWLNLYLEKDPQVAALMRRFLEENWWDRPGEKHTARLSKQPFWNMIYLTVTGKGASPELVSATRALLKGFPIGPYWDVARPNCDEGELAARECLAVDGTTVLRLEGPTQEGRLIAAEALDPAIRPTSNFNSRSNPFDVNGGADPLMLNPGGDLLASYWIGRYMQAGPAGSANVSPLARAHRTVDMNAADGDAEGENGENDEADFAADSPAETDPDQGAEGGLDEAVGPDGDETPAVDGDGAQEAGQTGAADQDAKSQADDGGGGCRSAQGRFSLLFLAVLAALGLAGAAARGAGIMPVWYLYILCCADGTLYTGSTTDPARRLEEHNRGLGSRYTAARRPVRLVYQEEHGSRSAAQAREAAVKRLPRKAKQALIGD